VRVLIERWAFKITTDKNKKFRKVFAYKKQSTLFRSIITYTRLLPAFKFFSEKGFNHYLEYKINTGEQIIGSISTVCNTCEVSNAKISMKIEFLNKQEIFKLEEELVKYIN
jgi:hypothetical protein